MNAKKEAGEPGPVVTVDKSKAMTKSQKLEHIFKDLIQSKFDSS